MVAEPRELKLRPRTLVEAKFSVYFTVALAFEAGSVTLDSFTAERLADDRVSSLAERVRFSADERIGIDAGRIEVTTRDGRTLVAEVPIAPGSPGNPISDEGLVAKFLACTAHAAAPSGEEAWAALAAAHPHARDVRRCRRGARRLTSGGDAALDSLTAWLRTGDRPVSRGPCTPRSPGVAAPLP